MLFILESGINVKNYDDDNDNDVKFFFLSKVFILVLKIFKED